MIQLCINITRTDKVLIEAATASDARARCVKLLREKYADHPSTETVIDLLECNRVDVPETIRIGGYAPMEIIFIDTDRFVKY